MKKEQEEAEECKLRRNGSNNLSIRTARDFFSSLLLLLPFSIKQIVGDFLNFYTIFIAVLDSRFTWSRNVEPPRLLSDFVVRGTKLSLPSIHLRHSCATFSSRILRRVFYVPAAELPLKDENCGCNCSLCLEEIYRGSLSEVEVEFHNRSSFNVINRIRKIETSRGYNWNWNLFINGLYFSSKSILT